MKSPSARHRKAIAHLERADPVMAEVISKVGPFNLILRTAGTHFDALVRAIVYQQLSGKAAATIHGRVLQLFDPEAPLPPQILSAEHETLRGAGLSNQKARYLRNLAEHSLNGSLPVESLHELSDEEIVNALIQVKGIGRWSAQMFLMFRLGRLDVLPDLDLGVQKRNSTGISYEEAAGSEKGPRGWGEVGSLPVGCVLVHVASAGNATRYVQRPPAASFEDSTIDGLSHVDDSF